MFGLCRGFYCFYNKYNFDHWRFTLTMPIFHAIYYCVDICSSSHRKYLDMYELYYHDFIIYRIKIKFKHDNKIKYSCVNKNIEIFYGKKDVYKKGF